MKIVIAAPNPSMLNMVKNAFQSMHVQNTDFVSVSSEEEATAALSDQSVFLIDWEFSDNTATNLVVHSKKIKPKVPVLLLATKQKAGTTFSGMKAGASGVVNKPFDPEELVRAVANALKSTAGKKQKVNVEFINPFIDATRNVFQTMCGVEISRKKLFLKEDYRMMGDVSGVMGLTGTATGSVVVSLSKDLACTIVGKMLGEDPSNDLTDDVCDGVGEIINMIAGQAKAMLVKTKYHFTISIPSVVSGSSHEISHKKGTPNIVVLFEALGQPFSLQVCLCPTEPDE